MKIFVDACIYGYNLGDCEGMKLRFDHRTGRVYDPEQELWGTEGKNTPKTNDCPQGNLIYLFNYGIYRIKLN